MRLEQLQYCIEVANSKSMSQAAKKLYITQPSLSTAIQNLEEELGFPIFNRSKHGVTVTEKGSLMLKKAAVIAEQLEAIKNLAINDEDMVCNITIAAVPAVCSAITAELIQAVQKQKRHINLSMMELRPEKILQQLIDGRADIVIGNYSECIRGNIYNEASKYNLVIEPIFEDRMYAFLSRNDPRARQNKVTIAELQQETQAFFVDCALMDADESSLQQVSVNRNFYSFTDKSSIKKVVASGLAYAILPYSMAYNDIYIDAGWIKALPIVDVDVTTTVYLAYKYSSRMMRETVLIAEIVRKLYDKIAQKMAEDIKHCTMSNENNWLLVY